MTPKNKLFIGILVFMLIVNILVIFNLNYFYIRAILAFIFLITIPGLLIMLCLKIRNINFWEYLVYTIGLSVSFIMFAGLAVNWILPFLNITDKPLSLYPILICFDTFLLALWLIAHKRNEDNAHILIFPFQEYEIKGKKRFKFIPKFPSLSWLDRIFIIIPMFFPFMAVIGAFLLNNHGTNIVTMILLGSIAVYVFLVVLFRDKLNENVLPWAILMISISLLLASSMRSWYVSGVDVNKEYAVFQLTSDKAFWSLSNFRDVYNAMLSVVILPTILSLFAKINDQLILKLFFPSIFMFVPLIVYLISKKYFKEIICFLASFFFISQPTFMTWITIPIRQEIAFLFFGLMLLVLFSKEINLTLKKFLFVIFGFSMIVSHYSTSYIALAIFLLTYIFTLIYKLYENRKIKKGKLKPEQKEQFYLTVIIILLLFIFTFLWYSQVTTTANNLINFMHKSFSNIGNMFSEDMQMKGQTPLEQFSIFNKQKDYNTELKKYVEESTTKSSQTNLYDATKYKDYKATLRSSNIVPYKFNYNIISIIFYFRELLRIIIGKILIVVGVIYLSFIFKKNKINPEYLVVILSCFLILFLIVILPFTTISYDLMRTYQQVLIILSIPAIFGILFVFKFLKERWQFLCIVVTLLIYFLFLSGFINQITGGLGSSINLNNFGVEYDMIFSHSSELLSGGWLKSNNNFEKIYVDNRGEAKLYLSGLQMKLSEDVLPSIINRKDYVYSDYTNINEQITFKSFRGNALSFNFPTEFLNDNKNKIYNNGGSEIFK